MNAARATFSVRDEVYDVRAAVVRTRRHWVDGRAAEWARAVGGRDVACCLREGAQAATARGRDGEPVLSVQVAGPSKVP